MNHLKMKTVKPKEEHVDYPGSFIKWRTLILEKRRDGLKEEESNRWEESE